MSARLTRHIGVSAGLLLLLAAPAWASLSFVPNPLLYGHMMAGLDPGTLPAQGALPPGSGAAVMAFARLLGLLAVARSLVIVYHMGESRHQGHGVGAAFVFFLGGVMVFHVDKTIGMLAATFPGFPNLTQYLQY